MKMKLVSTVIKRCILFLSLSSSVFIYCDHVFTYTEDVTPKYIEADGVSTWKFTATLTVPKTEAAKYDLSVSFQTRTPHFQICAINLNHCNVDEDDCYCAEKAEDDQSITYTFKLKKLAEFRLSEAPLFLQHPPYDPLDNSVNLITDDTQKYPVVFEVIIVTIREDGVKTTLKDGDNTVSLHGSDMMASVVKICAKNVFNGSFKLNSTQVELNDDDCIKIADTSKALSFSYNESEGLQRTALFTVKFVHVCEYADPCNGHECNKMSSSPGYMCNCTNDKKGNTNEDKTRWTVGKQCNETHACAESDYRTKCEEHGTCVYPHASEPGKQQCACELGYTGAKCQFKLQVTTETTTKGNEGTRPSGDFRLVVLMSLGLLFAEGVRSFAWL